MEFKETYRIRKDWSDPKSQIGAYINFDNAIAACDKAGAEYKIYDSKGEVVYAPKEEIKIKIPEEGGNGEVRYSEKNRPLCCLQTQSVYYKKNSVMPLRGILWLLSKENNPYLNNYIYSDDEAWIKTLGYNDNKNYSKSAESHAFIGRLDNDTIITIQGMPWNYHSYDCGGGLKGSCANGWIQIKICDDSQENFEKVYKEICEISAYLCRLCNFDPYGLNTVGNIKVPTILCDKEAYSLNLSNYSNDTTNWLLANGKTMKEARDDIAELLGVKKDYTPIPAYFVRSSWENINSQIGEFAELEEAKAACDEAGEEYEVYNTQGIAIYPEGLESAAADVEYKVGQNVRVVPGATYVTGTPVPNWVLKAKLYIREIYKNGDIVVSTGKKDALLGALHTFYLQPYTTPVTTFDPYVVEIINDTMVRTGPANNNTIVSSLKKHEMYTIISERQGWGKLKNGQGWINLSYTKKI